MSHIAAALAKTKKKAEGSSSPLTPSNLQPGNPFHPGETAPPMQDFPSDEPESRSKPNDARMRLLILVGAIAVVVVFVALARVRARHRAAAAESAAVAPVPTAASPQPAKPAESHPKPAAPSVAAATAAAPAAQTTAPAAQPAADAAAATVPPAEAPRPNDELMAAVKKFTITAVVSGPSGRARIDGKTYYAGDLVLPGLTLHSVKEGIVIFRDTDGAEYPRRF